MHFKQMFTIKWFVFIFNGLLGVLKASDMWMLRVCAGG